MKSSDRISFIRYPGGKQRVANELISYLPSRSTITGRFVDPFLGGGSVFFLLSPNRSLLSDLNPDLVDLYRSIRWAPHKVWKVFKEFPSTKRGYYKVRATDPSTLDLIHRAARTLYLNRTCFKGMWRQNSMGKFNIGYGGQSRRWVIDEISLVEIASLLKNVEILSSDFEPIVEECTKDDFLFLDPPYKPGQRELTERHYGYDRFTFEEHRRLARSLRKATGRGVKWAITISSHPDLLQLYMKAGGSETYKLSKGTGTSPGLLVNNSGEVLMLNYEIGGVN